MTVHSAGLALYRRGSGDAVEVLLAHMGGPFWARKDDGAWTFPKGEFDPSAETPLDAARREFAEELGFDPPAPDPLTTPADLGEVAASGKRIRLYAYEVNRAEPLGSFEPGTFEMEWPPRSGRRQSFPEVDRIGWFALDEAAVKLTKSLVPFLARIRAAIDGERG